MMEPVYFDENLTADDERQMGFFSRRKSFAKGSTIMLCTLSMLCGITTITHLTLTCFTSGFFLILEALIIIGLEVEWHRLSAIEYFFVDRPKWQKTALFGLLAILPVLLCKNTWSICGFIIILICLLIKWIMDVLEARALKRQMEESNGIIPE